MVKIATWSPSRTCCGWRQRRPVTEDLGACGDAHLQRTAQPKPIGAATAAHARAVSALLHAAPMETMDGPSTEPPLKKLPIPALSDACCRRCGGELVSWRGAGACWARLSRTSFLSSSRSFSLLTIGYEISCTLLAVIVIRLFSRGVWPDPTPDGASELVPRLARRAGSQHALPCRPQKKLFKHSLACPHSSERTCLASSTPVSPSPPRAPSGELQD